jgi:hypothetical protein
MNKYNTEDYFSVIEKINQLPQIKLPEGQQEPFIV